MSLVTSKPNRTDQHLRAGTSLLTNYPLQERAFTPVYIGVLDTYCGPTIRRPDWLRVPVRELALKPGDISAFRIGRSAYPREMRLTNATLHRSQTCALDYDAIRVSPD
jgi:hypothetical protein